MNQILEYDTENNSGKAPKSGGNRGSNGGGSHSDKVVKFFAFFLMLIAILLIASGVFSLVKNKKDSKPKISNAPKAVEAQIEAVKDETAEKVIVSVTSENAISKLIYRWDENTEKVIAGNDATTMEEEIDLPDGKHILYIKVVDKSNNDTSKNFTFEAETSNDTTPPEITIEITEQSTLLITAVDDNELAYITYKWNEEEEQTVYADERNPKEKQIELEIPMGRNTISVIAVDASSSSNTKSAIKTLEGVTKPEIECHITQDASTLLCTCTHEKGIKSIFYTCNGENFEYNANDDEISTELSFEHPASEGENNITIKVTSVDGITAEYIGTWQYNPNGNTGTEEQQ